MIESLFPNDRAPHLGIPPLPLNPQQTAQLCALLQQPSAGQEQELLRLLSDRVPPGVDQSAYVKASWLTGIAHGKITSPVVTPRLAVEMLGTMVGGYNVQTLIELLDNQALGDIAASALAKILLIFESFDQILELSVINAHAKTVVESWANAEWFLNKPALPETLTGIVFKVAGEINTDDLSPATHAATRSDIPLHALSMLETRSPKAIEKIRELQSQGYPVFFVGDVVGTGSSRKSAINSLLWHIGNDIPAIPNKRSGGVIIGGTIAPIFFNTAQDAGALPIQTDVSKLETGMVITIHPYAGEIRDRERNILATFQLTPTTIIDEVRAGGRIPLMIGRGLTDKTRHALGLPVSQVFIRSSPIVDTAGHGFTLAQKIVGKACGVKGVRPGSDWEPVVTTVGSQDTTGPMTRDELKELACLGFSADLVLQSFCHTAAYPKPADIKTHQELPDFIATRGGVALKVGDGIIHSWLNRMLLPDTVGTGGDSHTRFPLGISFPGGSGLVAFAAAIGTMPLHMPESVLVKFTGQLQAGVTLRDVVNAIPYVALQKGLLTLDKQAKQNIFAGRIMEMEGLPDLKVEQAFELTDASAERSCAGCTIKLGTETVKEFIQSNVVLIKNMLARGYQDGRTLLRRMQKMEAWLANPELMSADADAKYAEVLTVNLEEIKEPLVAAPNDPDNIKTLSEVAGDRIDEVFIGSCMTNIGHYRACAKVLEGEGQVKVRLWICPPTRMDEEQLKTEGYYSIFGLAGARMEVPGCSLCMGNQARVGDDTTVFSTSTRNFNNRMGKGARVYLGSAELAAVCALLGRIPTPAEYLEVVGKKINPWASDLYRYLNFHELPNYATEYARQTVSK